MVSQDPLHLRFDSITHPEPSQRIFAWREAMSLSVDVDFRLEEVEKFSGQIDFYPLRSVVLVEARGTAHMVTRSRDTITRTGDRHVIFDFFAEGGFSGTAGGDSVTVGPGDCFLMDMRGTLRLHLKPFRYIGVIIPLTILHQHIDPRRPLHGLHWPAGTMEAGLLGAVLEGFLSQAAQLTRVGAMAFGQSLISLIGASIAASGSPPMREASLGSEPDVARLRRHVARHASDPSLDPDALARAFGLSRATLYRLFKPFGGVAGDIRLRRAMIARRLLSQSAHGDWSNADIAQASGFADARSLTRALREAYGTTPSELRGMPMEGESGPIPHIEAMFDAGET